MLTQVASSFIGDSTDDLVIEKLEGVYSLYGNIIHITDAKNDNILDVITARNVLENLHHKSLKDNFETFDFEVFGGKSYDEYLQKGNRIIIPGEDQSDLLEFVIDDIDDIRDTHKRFEVRSYASYLDLKKAKVIDPFRRTAKAREHMIHALTNTEFEVGFVESDRAITLSFDKHTNPFEYLKRIAREFDLELNFRIEHNGVRVTKRVVDAEIGRAHV